MFKLWSFREKNFNKWIKKNGEYEVNVRALIDGSSGDWSETKKFKFEPRDKDYCVNLAFNIFGNNIMQNQAVGNNNQGNTLFGNNNQRNTLFGGGNQRNSLFGNNN